MTEEYVIATKAHSIRELFIQPTPDRTEPVRVYINQDNFANNITRVHCIKVKLAGFKGEIRAHNLYFYYSTFEDLQDPIINVKRLSIDQYTASMYSNVTVEQRFNVFINDFYFYKPERKDHFLLLKGTNTTNYIFIKKTFRS